MSNTVKKPTQRVQYAELIALAKSANRLDLVEFCESRIEQIDKKNAKSSDKLTPTQIANKAIKEAIVTVVSAKPMTVSEMIKTNAIKALETDGPFNNQKISALANQLVGEGILVKSTEKGKSYFALNTEKVEG
jgi:hypothetical protein